MQSIFVGSQAADIGSSSLSAVESSRRRWTTSPTGTTGVVYWHSMIRVRRAGGVEVHDTRLTHVRETLRSALWFVPSLFVVAAVVLAFGSVALDRQLKGEPAWLAYNGGPSSAQQILTTIATSMMTFTGLVFTITIVVLQLASGQFSPRVLRSFLRDRGSQASLGVFTATFAYSLFILGQIRTGSVGPVFVPGLSITIALTLVTVSLITFVYFVNHIAQSIRVVDIIASVAEDTHASIDAVWSTDFPAQHEVPDLDLSARGDVMPLRRRGGGVVVGLDVDGLVEIATHHGCVLRLLPKVGDFVANGAPLFEIYGGHGTPRSEELHRQIDLGGERTMYQDPAFGVRQLVDIAVKALSPALNDPTTAVQAIDRLHDILSHLARLPAPADGYCDATGELRLVRALVSWPGFVALAFEEIREYGGSSVQVQRRLRASLDELLSIAPPDRCPPLVRQLRLLQHSTTRYFPEPEERSLADQSDQSGIGGGTDVD